MKTLDKIILKTLKEGKLAAEERRQLRAWRRNTPKKLRVQYVEAVEGEWRRVLVTLRAQGLTGSEIVQKLREREAEEETQ